MLRYAVRRGLTFIPLLLVILAFTYALAFFGPGDPLYVILGENWSDQATYQNLRRQYGLDRPLPVQFAEYIVKAVQGDFGRSYIMRVGVGELMAKAWPITAQLALVSILITAALGIGLGAVAALRPQSWLGSAILTLGIATHSVPPYVLAPIVLVVLVLQLRWMNTPAGWHGIFSYQTLVAALVLSLPPLLGVIRQTRSSVMETLTQDYVRTARAKGVSERLILWRHVLKNAITPVMTSLGLTFGFLLGGSIFVESAFAIPGFGLLYFTALRNTDYPLLLGTTIVSAFWIMSVNLLVDLAYGWIDPRVRLQ